MDSNVAAALADVKAVLTEMDRAIGPYQDFIPAGAQQTISDVKLRLHDAVARLEAAHK